MATKKVTDIDVAQSLSNSMKILITQTEEVGGVDTPVVRRAELDDFVDKMKDGISDMFNTPYDEDTNKAATMADISDAVGDIEDALIALRGGVSS